MSRAQLARELLSIVKKGDTQLQFLNDMFRTPLNELTLGDRETRPIGRTELRTIFSTSKQIAAVVKTAADALEARMHDWTDAKLLSGALLKTCDLVKPVVEYARGFVNAVQTLCSLRHKQPAFRACLTALQTSAVSAAEQIKPRGLVVGSLLRCLVAPLLFAREYLVKLGQLAAAPGPEGDSRGLGECVRQLEAMQTELETLNASHPSALADLVDWAQILELCLPDPYVADVQLIVPGRRLVAQTMLDYAVSSDSPQPGLAFLLNDMLVLARRAPTVASNPGAPQFVLKYALALTSLVAVDSPQHYLEAHLVIDGGRLEDVCMRFSRPALKSAWMDALNGLPMVAVTGSADESTDLQHTPSRSTSAAHAPDEVLVSPGDARALLARLLVRSSDDRTAMVVNLRHVLELSAGELARITLRENHAITAVAGAVRLGHADAEIVSLALAALANLSASPVAAQELLDADICLLLTEALDRHADSAAVVFACASAAHNLVQSSTVDAVKALLETETPAAFVAVIDKHAERPAVLHAVFRALHVLHAMIHAIENDDEDSAAGDTLAEDASQAERDEHDAMRQHVSESTRRLLRQILDAVRAHGTANPSLAAAAFALLKSMTFKSSRTRDLFAEAGGVQLAVQLMREQGVAQVDVILAGAGLIKNATYDCVKALLQAAYSGAVPIFVDLITASRGNTDLQLALVGASVNFLALEANTVLLRRCGGVRVLSDAVSNNPVVARQYGATVASVLRQVLALGPAL